MTVLLIDEPDLVRVINLCGHSVECGGAGGRVLHTEIKRVIRSIIENILIVDVDSEFPLTALSLRGVPPFIRIICIDERRAVLATTVVILGQTSKPNTRWWRHIVIIRPLFSCSTIGKSLNITIFWATLKIETATS